VVSLPCWELFEKQTEAYRDEVLPAGVPKLAIEAGVPFGWERWVGNDKRKGDIMGVARFGASAPYKRVYEELGLTVDEAVKRAKALVSA
jgi:transketolase